MSALFLRSDNSGMFKKPTMVLSTLDKGPGYETIFMAVGNESFVSSTVKRTYSMDDAVDAHKEWEHALNLKREKEDKRHSIFLALFILGAVPVIGVILAFFREIYLYFNPLG